MSNLHLTDAIRNSLLTGYDLRNAIGEALGAASTTFHADGTYNPDAALKIASDLEGAILKAIEVAVNWTSLDADLGMADWEIAELLGQTSIFGFEKEDA